MDCRHRRLDSLENPSAASGGKSVFHVDTSLIQATSLTDQDVTLQQLGLNVFNQDQFEQGVMAQVDQAMALQEKERIEKMAKKELKSVRDDIRTVSGELANIDKVLATLKPTPAMNPKDVKRKREAVLRQKDNKLKQLKKIKAKEKSLLMKLDESFRPLEDEDQSLIQDGSHNLLEQALSGISAQPQESEQERLLRLGEMTPFGTRMNFAVDTQVEPPIPAPKPPKPEMTDFEKYLLGQETKTSTKKQLKTPSKKKQNSGQEKVTRDRKYSSEPKSKSGAQSSRKSESKTDEFVRKYPGGNFFDKKSKNPTQTEKDFSNYKSFKAKFPKLKHAFSGDGRISDPDPLSDEGDVKDGEYIPHPSEWRQSGSEDEMMNKSPAKRKRVAGEFKSKKRKLPPLAADMSDEEQDPRAAGTSLSRSKDDGNREAYLRRLQKHKKDELKHKHEKLAAGEEDLSDEEDDAEFDGGFVVPSKIWKKLYRYQKTCVKWLWELHGQQAGGIIGDEMGLGKTIQMISFLAALRHSNLRNKRFRFTGLGPVIIVCPATVMHQWVREFHAWWPEFRVAILHSTGSYTGSEDHLIYNIVNSCGVLITSYTGLVIQQELLLKHKWHYIILDEGHKIRNPDAQATLVCKQFRTPHRIILSGSPIQNNLKELWSLFDFVFPGKLGTLPDFMQHFSIPIVQGGYSNASDVQVQTAYKCACVLRDTINPYLLRRMKADVQNNIQLPKKSEQVLFCRLTEDQREVYKEYLDSRECQSILSGTYMVFPGLITLRKICNHPDLSTGGPKYFSAEFNANSPTSKFGYWRRSGKMIVIEALLKIWKTQGHRVLLFTQSRQMLDILEDFTQERAYNYMRMDGGTTIGSRQSLINKFNSDESIFVFLLTTKVGGLGVNLTGANRIIIYDPDWNPSTDLQARERAWRIGQKKEVTVYRLLTTGSIEEKIYHRQIFKQFLTNRILKDPKQRRFFKSNDLHELFTLNSENNKHGTETSAIFAGTGSDVRVKIPQPGKSKNRFDLIRERKEREKKEKGSAQQTEEIDSDEEDVRGAFSDSKMEKMRELARKLSQKLATGDISSTTATGDKEPKPEKQEKKKKRKKKRDAVFEGETISNLVKHEDYAKPSADKDEKSSSLQDDYVLRRLFKKSGVHSALKHDAIMESSNADYALVEAEAERVAKEAARALKSSRSRCMNASSGVPTWTGNSGISGAPGMKKPKFGGKKNSQITGLIPTSQATSTLPKPPKEKMPSFLKKPKLFDGEKSGLSTTASTLLSPSKSTAAATKETVESSNLLASMRARNHRVTQSDSEEEQSGERAATTRENVDSVDQELIEELRCFVAFQGSTMDGQATTQDIIQHFGDRLPTQDSVKFKAMLNQICTFQRMGGIGLWTLKTAFR
ncbi:DNA excision repair protein ERCC-6-like [Tubulanus polymorphus]|uniref:DNA excision repair protein ERCC-6-like n=1 Tax=Tubulanus polymorphus TaxID=672921 RepID=UPI003DA3E73A